jgi:hypothetical protein
MHNAKNANMTTNVFTEIKKEESDSERKILILVSNALIYSIGFKNVCKTSGF